VSGPDTAGSGRVYRWSLDGGKTAQTELRVLEGEKMAAGAAGAGVVQVYDLNDSVYLVRASDGALLASVYATRGGGWIAQSRAGAVDASDAGRAAAVTVVEGGGAAPTGGTSRLAWDRFAVGGLLARAAVGEVVDPP